MSRPHVLIVGAGGAVGSRLARLLARSGLFRVSLGARDGEHVLSLAQELRGIDPQGEFGFVALDRTRISAERLREIGCWIVVDCAGPSAGGGTALVEAAIAARCHLIDVEDGRDHLDGLLRFDAVARAAGVAVLSGAATTPALTHALCNSLAAGWRQIDSVDISILHGSESEPGPLRKAAVQKRGKARGRLFAEGAWQSSPVRAEREVAIEGGGRHRVAVLDGVDLDLLVARFRPRLRAQVTVGEASVWSRLRPHLKSLKALHRLGRRDGGMVVEIAGLDQRLEPRVARWTLMAQNGDEAYLPAIAAAATIVALVKGQARTGVHTAAGVVTLEGARPWLAGLDVHIRTAVFKREVPLLARAMGASFVQLPESVQRLHRGRPAIVAQGLVAVLGASNRAGGLLARLFGLPSEGSNVPLRLLVEAREGREHVTLWFGETPIRSVRSLRRDGLIEERFGAIRLLLAPTCAPAGLEVVSVGARLGLLPLPSGLTPRCSSTTRVDGQRLHIELCIELSLVGRLFGYRGWLEC